MAIPNNRITSSSVQNFTCSPCIISITCTKSRTIKNQMCYLTGFSRASRLDRWAGEDWWVRCAYAWSTTPHQYSILVLGKSVSVPSLSQYAQLGVIVCARRACLSPSNSYIMSIHVSHFTVLCLVMGVHAELWSLDKARKNFPSLIFLICSFVGSLRGTRLDLTQWY